MLTVIEGARRTGRNPEIVRRWIRTGKLPAHTVGGQHLIDETDLELVVELGSLPSPPEWRTTATGEPMPDWLGLLRQSRASHFWAAGSWMIG